MGKDVWKTVMAFRYDIRPNTETQTDSSAVLRGIQKNSVWLQLHYIVQSVRTALQPFSAMNPKWQENQCSPYRNMKLL